MVSNWEPAHTVVEDAISGAKIAPCLSALVVPRLPLCLRQGVGDGDGLDHSQLALLWYWLNLLFYEWARLCLRFRAFHQKVLFL